MKKNLPLPLIFILFSLELFGQSFKTDSVFESKLCGEVYEMAWGFNGSQYYNNEWINSDIVLTNGDTVYNKLLKYNGFIDEVIWKNDENKIEIKLEKYFISEFSLKNIQGKNIHFKRLQVKLSPFSETSDIFVQILCENQSSCFVYRKIVIKGYDLTDIDGKTYISKDLIPQPYYILILPDKENIIFKRISKHTIMKSLPEKYRIQSKEILQKKHLALRNEENLKTFIENLK